MPARAVPAADSASSFLPRFCELPDELSRPSPLLHGFLGPKAVAIVAIVGAPRCTRAKPAVQPASGSPANGRTPASCSGPGLGATARCGPNIRQSLLSSLVHGVDFQLRMAPGDFARKQAQGRQPR